MNKQEFIEYIEKLPNEIDFTPMHLDVKAESPNADGSYRTITKKIKFECSYTELVHQLPVVQEDKVPRGETYLEIVETIQMELDGEEESKNSLFFQKVNELQDSMYNLVVPLYGKSIKEVGEIPIFVFANLLLHALKSDNDTADFACELNHETRNALHRLVMFLT